MKKFLLSIYIIVLGILSVSAIKVNACEGKEELYFQTYKYEKADEYVENTVGDFINCESNINLLNINEIKLGQGIYVETFEQNETLPAFMYPIFIRDKLEYVYRIYDNGNGNYEGIFGKNYVELLLNNASHNPEKAPIFVQNNGNEIMVIGDSIKVVLESYIGNVDYNQIKNQIEKTSLSAVNISEEQEFIKKPKKKMYNWTLSIDIKETQGNFPWCAAYVTATALRYKTGQNILASQIMDYYGKGTQDSCSIDMIKGYSKIKGIFFDGTYSGPISSSNLHGHLRGMNPVYAGYKRKGGTSGHALLIHGISDDKRLVWNPWYNYSEWTSSSNIYQTKGITYEMYRYGTYF